jgi:squalene-associated FAD-dependent desaturase
MAGRGRPRVAVVGAGWAGLSAAFRLARAGVSVLLLEERPAAGGRAFSFVDGESGLLLDNGQHVLLGCCRRFVALLEEVGLRQVLSFQDRLFVPVYREGRRAEVRGGALPGALTLLPLLRYGHLDRDGRSSLLRLLLRLGTAFPRQGLTFAGWLGLEASDPLLACLLDPMLVAVLNRHAWEVDARSAVQALRRGFLAGPRASRLGFFRRPLGELAAAMIGALSRAGVEVRLGRAVEAVLVEEGRTFAVVLRGQEAMPVDGVIVAVPPTALLRLLPKGLAQNSFFARLRGARASPILNVYLRYDRPMLEDDLVAVACQHAPVLVNRSRLLGEDDEDGRLLALSVSAADRLLALPRQELVPTLLAQVARALPAFARERPTFVRAIWQRQATIRLDPEGAALRLPPSTPLPNLWLAGDWTDTGWPPSLESAVVSGERAAALAISRLTALPGEERPVRVRNVRPARLDPGARLATDQVRPSR